MGERPALTPSQTVGPFFHLVLPWSDGPEVVNEDPYGQGWLVRVKLSDPSETEQLLDASSYEATLK